MNSDEPVTGGSGLHGAALKARRRPRPAPSEQRARLLDGRAWEEFCRDLAAAGRHILEFPLGGAETEELRAEGFRYLVGLVRSGLYQALELADPDRPSWIRNPDSEAKWGADNPDNQYLWARIRADATYRVFGERRNVFDFLIEAKEGYVQLGEDRVFAAATLGDLHVDAQGRFDLLLAAERPAGYAGDFLPIHPEARYLQVRQYLVDWERESPATFHIERADGRSQPNPRLTAAAMAERIGLAGEWTLATARFWSEWVEQLRAAHQPNRVAPARRYTGGAPDVHYGNSWYRLAPDEALIFESEIPEARYWQIGLCDPWFKSLDYATRQTSLNHRQAHISSDGRFRCAIAQDDPGVPNWLDTTGLAEGVIQYRWVWTKTNPQPTVRIVPFAELAAAFPPDTPRLAHRQPGCRR